MPPLRESAYVVLGLLRVYGPGTSYDLKRWSDGSIGFFWSFPRAQLYVEPIRLASEGLVRVSEEQGGRRRKTYRITAKGISVLHHWLRDIPARVPELRDAGLLKLYFSSGSPDEVVALARSQVAIHSTQLARYRRLRPTLERSSRDEFALATLRFGLAFEEQAVDFWKGIGARPPSRSGEASARTGPGDRRART